MSELKVVIAIMVALVFGLSLSNNPPNGKTAAPLDGSCGECHNGSTSLDGEVSINGLPSTVISGQSYMITITLDNTVGSASRGGFQWVALDSGNSNTGIMSNAQSGTVITNSGGRTYHEHSGQQQFNGASQLNWTIDWTAPSGPDNEVITFYVGSVLGNGSGSGGDKVKHNNISTTLDVQVPPLSVQLDYSQDPSCNGYDDGEAGLLVSGGLSPYTYTWDNGETTNPASNLTAGLHSVTVSDAGVDNEIFFVTLGEPDPVDINLLTFVDITCTGTSDGIIEVEGTGGANNGYVYAWSDGANSPLRIDLPAGNYTVTVTDTNQCTAIGNYTITEDGPVPSTSGDQIFCSGDLATIMVDQSFDAYLWNTGSTSQIIQVAEGGLYSVTVTDANGCTGSSIHIIEEIALEEPLFNGDVSICPEVGGQLSVTQLYNNYLWNNGSQNKTISLVACDTIYSVTVSDNNGCSTSASVFISCADDIEINVFALQNISCYGLKDGIIEVGASSNNASDFDYAWSNGMFSSFISNLDTGQYSVTVTDEFGCTNSAVYSIFEPDSLGLAIDTIIPTLCYGDSNSLIQVSGIGGTGSFEFFWPDSITGDSIVGLGNGTFDVFVVDEKFCADSFTVEVIGPDSLRYDTLLLEDSYCHGGAFGSIDIMAVGGTAPYEYLWSNGDTTSLASNLLAGTYGVTITDSLLCKAASMLTIDEQQAIIINATATAETIPDAEDGSIEIEVSGGNGGPYGAFWSNGESGAMVDNLAPGLYTVTVSDPLSCTASLNVFIDEAPCTLNLEINVTDVSCKNGSDGSVEVIVENHVGTYSILWSEDLSPDALSAGQYSFTVTDEANCQATANVFVEEPNAVSAGIVIDKYPSCTSSDDGAITVLVDGGTPPYSYAWSNGGDTQLIDFINPDTYVVTVTDDQGCTMTASQVLQYVDTIPPALLLQDISVYVDENGNVPLPTVEQFDLGSFDLCEDVTLALIMLAELDCNTGTQAAVNIIATDFSGNTSELMAQVTVLDTIAPKLTCRADTVISNCDVFEFEEAFLALEDNCGIGEIQQIGGLPSGSVFPIGVTVQEFLVMDLSGNSSTCSFNIINEADLQLNLIGQDLSCYESNDGAIQILIEGPNEPFDIQSSTEQLEQLAAGQYYVTVVDDKQCIAIDSIYLAQPDSLIIQNVNVTDASSPSSFDGAIAIEVIGGTGPYSYSWLLNNEEISSDSIINELGPGFYSVLIIDDQACEVSMLDIEIEALTSQNLELTSEQLIHIYPTPSSDVLHVKLDEAVISMDLNIFNSLGELYYSESVRDTKEWQINIQNWPSGVYYLKSTVSNKAILRTIVKQ